MKLKSTGKADKMKQGNLAAEITHINKEKDAARDSLGVDKGILHGGGGGTEKNLDWEKPEWTKGVNMKATGKGDKLKEGNLAKEITHVNKEKDESRDKIEGVDKGILHQTKKGQKLAEKGDLAKPITFPKGKP